jgi:O-acetyl-ADP-ribose deacetylase (regulator of RNase III)
VHAAGRAANRNALVAADFGDAMQRELHAYLTNRGVKYVPPETVVQTSPCGLPVRIVLHAVAIDPFYSSNLELVRSTVGKALMMASKNDARRVTLTALATGYGRLDIQTFAEAIQPLMFCNFEPIDEVIVCVRREEQRKELAQAINLML